MKMIYENDLVKVNLAIHIDLFGKTGANHRTLVSLYPVIDRL